VEEGFQKERSEVNNYLYSLIVVMGGIMCLPKIN